MSGPRYDTGFAVFESPVVSAATAIKLGIDAGKTHCFLGAKFYSDAAGETPATPTGGTIAVDIQTLNSSPAYEPPPVSTIDASNPATLSWAANTDSVRATPSGVAGAAYWRILVTCNWT